MGEWGGMPSAGVFLSPPGRGRPSVAEAGRGGMNRGSASAIAPSPDRVPAGRSRPLPEGRGARHPSFSRLCGVRRTGRGKRLDPGRWIARSDETDEGACGGDGLPLIRLRLRLRRLLPQGEKGGVRSQRRCENQHL